MSVTEHGEQPDGLYGGEYEAYQGPIDGARFFEAIWNPVEQRRMSLRDDLSGALQAAGLELTDEQFEAMQRFVSDRDHGYRASVVDAAERVGVNFSDRRPGFDDISPDRTGKFFKKVS